MSNLITPFRLIAVGLLVTLAATAMAADNDLRHYATRSGLHFYAGGDVDVTEPADTVFAAGGEINVSSKVVGEVIAAGGHVEVQDTTTGRIIGAGGQVEIRNTTAKDVIAAGGHVELLQAKLQQDAILSAGTVKIIDSDIGGDLIATGGTLEIGGTFGGDVTLRGGEIKLAPNTKIAGNLTYATDEELKLPEGAQVSGTIIRKEWKSGDNWMADFGLGKLIGFAIAALVGVTAALLLFSGVVLAFFAPQVNRAAATVTDQPLQSLGLGVLLAIALPVTVIVLMITIIGIPLGLFVMAAYGVLFGLGIVVVAYWVGMYIRDVFTHDKATPRYLTALGWTLVGLVAFTLVGLIPLLGNLAQFFALVTGFGAFILATTRQGRAVI
jgi:uncharacterized membrane protein YccF (DUF307 family)